MLNLSEVKRNITRGLKCNVFDITELTRILCDSTRPPVVCEFFYRETERGREIEEIRLEFAEFTSLLPIKKVFYQTE